VITSLAWLPLVPLTVLNGRFAAGVQVPFLYDYEVHARLLFSVPLLVLAELIVYVRMRALAAQFSFGRNKNHVDDRAVALRDGDQPVSFLLRLAF